jgi:hypothetical protein
MLKHANQTVARELEWICEGVSPMHDPCEAKVTYQCGICGRWFCLSHAEDGRGIPYALELPWRDGPCNA